MPKLLSNLKPSTVLIRAKQVLLDNKWTTNTYAKKANGHTVCDVMDPAATCFCAVGAVFKAVNLSSLDRTSEPANATEAINYLITEVSYDISMFNDEVGTTKKDILKAFDSAIVLALKDKR